MKQMIGYEIAETLDDGIELLLRYAAKLKASELNDVTTTPGGIDKLRRTTDTLRAFQKYGNAMDMIAILDDRPAGMIQNDVWHRFEATYIRVIHAGTGARTVIERDN